MNQPQYASDISISGVEETVTEDVRLALLDIGLVYPGLQINVDNKRITIVDVNDSLDASMDKLSIRIVTPYCLFTLCHHHICSHQQRPSM